MSVCRSILENANETRLVTGKNNGSSIFAEDDPIEYYVTL